MVDGCHLQGTLGIETKLNLQSSFYWGMDTMQEHKAQKHNCLFETFIICITTSFISITLKLFHCLYLISGYDIPAMYVQGHLALSAHHPCLLMAHSAPSLGAVYSCMLLQIVPYFWGHWGTKWGIATFSLCRLPEKADIYLDNCSLKLTVDEIHTSI